jgi:tRNA G37 N-methylase Trm5
LSSAVLSSKAGSEAIIHYYVHVSEEKFREKDWILRHLDEVGMDRAFEVTLWKKVREVGPRYIQAVADIRLLP